MGLLEQIYSVFGLGYSIALVILKHKDFSGTDIAFMAGTAVFVGLNIGSYINEVHLIPWGYKWRFTGKSLLRELLGPLLSLLYYPILFGHSDRAKRALTFSNEAYDGVERTRQLQKFELVELERGVHYNLKDHCLSQYEGNRKWGYDRLVGEIWVRVRFEDVGERYDATQGLKLQTSVGGQTSLEEYTPANLLNNDAIQGRENKIVNVSCLEWIWGDLERGSIPADPRTPLLAGHETSGTCRTDDMQYNVTITRRRGICRIERGECWLCPGFTWNLKCTVVRNWTLFKIHQYMLCLDVWGNNPKQGIWKLSTNDNQRFRYCYRHDELIDAIGRGMRLRQTGNRGIRYTVV